MDECRLVKPEENYNLHVLFQLFFVISIFYSILSKSLRGTLSSLVPFWLILWASEHAEDDDPMRWDFHVNIWISVILGTFIGLSLSKVKKWPKIYDDSRFETLAFLISAIGIYLGVALISGLFSDFCVKIGEKDGFILGMILIVVSSIWGLFWIYWCLFIEGKNEDENDIFNKRQNLKYFMVLLLFCLSFAPVVPLIDDINHFEGLLLVIALILVFPILYIFTGYISLKSVFVKKKEENSPFGRESTMKNNGFFSKYWIHHGYLNSFLEKEKYDIIKLDRIKSKKQAWDIFISTSVVIIIFALLIWLAEFFLDTEHQSGFGTKIIIVIVTLSFVWYTLMLKIYIVQK